jgi:hypothetical protein
MAGAAPSELRAAITTTPVEARPASAGTGEPPDARSARRFALVATAVAVTPVVVAGVRGALTGWIPTGDDAYSAVRAWDVFSANPPLLGTWSSASTYTGHEINHAGPLQFDLLAVPVRLLGHDAGTALGLTAINAAAVALVGWLVRRRLGPAAAALAVAFSALLSWSMGSEMLYDPWSQHAPLIPFSLFLVAAWCALAGDPVALPVMVVSGAYAVQTHLSYSLLVPWLTLFTLGALAARLVLARRADPGAWPRRRRATVRWAVITAGVGLACWAQPLVEQLTSDGEGNVTGLLRSADHGMRTPGWGKAIRALGGTVAVPPMWLPPSYGSPSFEVSGVGRPTGLAAAGLVVLAVALATLGWRAHRRGSTPVAAGAATALAALTVGLVTTLRMPLPLGMVPTYSRFMWPLGMVVWLALVVAVADEVRAARPRVLTARRLALAGLAVAVVAAVATLPTVDNATAAPRWSMDAVRAIDDDVVVALDGERGVLVEMPYRQPVGYVGPPLFSVLQEAGVPFYVADEHLVSQLGEARRHEPGDAGVRLIVRGGAAGPEPGERLVASWEGLDDDEAAELGRLEGEVRSIVARHGLVLSDGSDRTLRSAGRDDMVDRAAEAQDDPDGVIEDGTVLALWSGPVPLFVGSPLVDTEVFPSDLMERWADLADQRANQRVRVYVAPIA